MDVGFGLVGLIVIVAVWTSRLTLSDGSGIRTLVSGQAGDEFWTLRATKVSREIFGLAQEARGESADDFVGGAGARWRSRGGRHVRYQPSSGASPKTADSVG